MLLEMGRLTEGLWERGLATFNLPKLVCVVNNIQEIRFAVLDKTCKKQRSQPYCCSKLASNHSGQLLFCFKLARIVRNVKLVWNTVRNCPVARNWRQNTLRNCLFVRNWLLLLRSQNLSKTPCATLLLLEIGVKTLCATVFLFEIGQFC